MSKYAALLNPTATPQSEPLNERQSVNSAGGFVFTLDKWKRLERWLILGSDAPTYYQTAKALTKENAKVVMECLSEDAARAIRAIVEVSVTGRAPKNDPAIFALALATTHTDVVVRSLAYLAVKEVCRTATHLMQFVDTARGLGKGFGRGMKRAVADWYDGKPVDKLAYQMVKYRQREGYTHNRLIDLARPSKRVGTHSYDALYQWALGKAVSVDALPEIVSAHLEAMQIDKDSPNGVRTLCTLITDNKLPWEALPTWANTVPEVWDTMLPHLGMTALIRNLGNMSRVGTIKPLSAAEQTVAKRLRDVAELKKARVHPFHILQAMKVYGDGRSLKGGSLHRSVDPTTRPSWTPSQIVMDALNDAFYLAFQAVVPTGKRHYIGLDISGSMGSSFMGSSLTVREASCAMAMVTNAVEPATYIAGFTSKGGRNYYGSGYGGTSGMTPITMTAKDRLDAVCRRTAALPMGGTDCALPMLDAIEKKLEVDSFLILTDNETWAGGVHPVQALKDYRKKSGIPAKLVVVGMTATKFSIADPQDGGMLDCVGMDSATPAVISDFVRS